MAGFLGTNAYWQKSMNPLFGDQIMGNPWKSQLLMVKSACLCWLHHLQWPCASSYWNLQKKWLTMAWSTLQFFYVFSSPGFHSRSQPGCASRPRRHRSTDSSVLVHTNVIKAIVRHPQFSTIFMGAIKIIKIWMVYDIASPTLAVYIYTVLCTTIYTVLFSAYWHIRYNEI